MPVFRTGKRSCVVTAEERPTHGYPDGSVLTDTMRMKQYYRIDISGTKYWLPISLFSPAAMTEQVGRYDGSIASGLYEGIGQYGNITNDFTFGGGTTQRLSTRFLTNATANSVSGQRVPYLISRRVFNPILMNKIGAGNNTITRHFHGLASFTTQIPGSITNPLGNTDSGVLMGFLESEANFKVFYNDGTGAPPTPVDTGIAKSTLLRCFIIEFIDSVPKVVWYLLDGYSLAILATGELTTRIPAQSTGLTPHWHVETTTTTAINLYIISSELRQKS